MPNAKSQAILIDFLLADLDLAFTMLRTAEIEAASDPAHCKAALAKVREALGTIRSLAVRIEGPARNHSITARADELESALAMWSK